MAVAVLVAAVLHQLLPPALRVQPGWVYLVGIVAILVVLFAGDPGRIDQRKRWLAVVT